MPRGVRFSEDCPWGILSKHAVPVGVRADVVVVAEVLEDGPAHLDRVDGTLDAVEDFTFGAEGLFAGALTIQR